MATRTDLIVAAGGRIYPEFTWYAVAVGWLLGVIIAASIGFAALKLGFSIEGSELAAILGFAILRGMLGRRSIVANSNGPGRRPVRGSAILERLSCACGEHYFEGAIDLRADSGYWTNINSPSDLARSGPRRGLLYLRMP